MKNKSKQSMYTILARIVAIICITSSLAIGIIFTFTARQNVINSSDEKLLTSASLYHEILGRHYHDQIIDSNSVSDIDYLAILERNGEICRELNLQYLGSVMEVDGELRFTSATRSNLTIPDSAYAQFFETHRNPEAFSGAMGDIGIPVFLTFHNEWGEGRMILIPRLDDQSRRYIIGASIQLEEFKFLIYKSIFLSILSEERKSLVIISCKLLSKLIEIKVEDNGVGIDLERNGEDLFKMYKKFHNSPDSKGFGLYLAQVQAESLGGFIRVESKVGLGSKFTVSIPYE